MNIGPCWGCCRVVFENSHVRMLNYNSFPPRVFHESRHKWGKHAVPVLTTASCISLALGVQGLATDHKDNCVG